MKWVALAIAMLAAVPARADDDQDRAMEAVAHAEVLPLAQILPAIEEQYGARLLAVEFHRANGAFIYEFELITPDGRMSEIAVDAATGLVLPPGSEPDTGEDGGGSD